MEAIVERIGVLGYLNLFWRQARLAGSELGCHAFGEAAIAQQSCVPVLRQIQIGKAVGQGEGVVVLIAFR